MRSFLKRMVGAGFLAQCGDVDRQDNGEQRKPSKQRKMEEEDLNALADMKPHLAVSSFGFSIY